MTKFTPQKALLVSIGLVLFKLALLVVVSSRIEKPVFCSWDCPYYKEIAEVGYTWKPNQQGPLAFFPLYPKSVGLIRDTFFPNVEFAKVGIGINLLLFGTFSFMFMYWCWLVGLKLYWLPPIILAFDRFSLWAMVPYTEPLFLNFMLLFLISLRQLPLDKFPRLLAASLIGGLASASRIVGVAFVAALGLAHFGYFIRRPHLGFMCLVAGVSGVLVFFGYLHVNLGAWNLSLRTTANWGREFSLLGVFNSIFYLIKHFYFPTILIFALTLWGIFKSPSQLSLNLTEKLLMAWLIFIPMANTIPVGVSRYFSVLIFGPLLFSYLIEKYKLKHFKLLSLGMTLFFVSEIYWQATLLGKFLRVEVFSWAG